jgi:hypothetical protein
MRQLGRGMLDSYILETRTMLHTNKARSLPKPGATFKKEYKGTTYVLSVMEQKGRLIYRLRGESFNSPSAAAKSLTNYEINGWVFWSMDER